MPDAIKTIGSLLACLALVALASISAEARERQRRDDFVGQSGAPGPIDGVEAAGATQRDPQRVKVEIQRDWAAEYDESMAGYRLVSPAYESYGACVITVIEVPTPMRGAPDYSLMSIKRELLFRPEPLDCASARRADFAEVHRDSPLWHTVRFLQRVVAGPGAGSQYAEGTDPALVRRCTSSPWGVRSRFLVVGQSDFDHDDGNDYFATIHCAELPEGSRLIAKGQSWDDGHLEWTIAGPPPPLPCEVGESQGMCQVDPAR